MATRPLEILRSAFHWSISMVYFIFAGSILLFLTVFLKPRPADRFLRIFCRHIMFLAGASIEVEYSPRFDPRHTCLFVGNHVNLFDPIILGCVIPQFARGLELESHFSIPLYGWLSKGLGNIPVPDVRTPSGLKRMWKASQEGLNQGTSLVIFPEGTRTKTGRVGVFKDGAFRMAHELGYPIVPISMRGSFEFNTKMSWMLRPGKISVRIHDEIDAAEVKRKSPGELRDQVRAVIVGAVEL